jgi:hypothetical protein
VLGTSGYAISSLASVPMSENADSLVLLLGERASGTVDTIARIRGRGPFGLALSRRGRDGGGSSSSNPLASSDLSLLFPDGWVAVAASSPYRVDWRAPDGRWTPGPALPVSRTPVDRSEKCAALQRAARGRLQSCDPDAVPGWPRDLPPFLDRTLGAGEGTPPAFAAPGGSLVIRRTPGATISTNQYDVVDRRGVLQGVLSLPANEAIVGFGARSVFVVALDEFDVQHLRRHPWPL